MLALTLFFIPVVLWADQGQKYKIGQGEILIISLGENSSEENFKGILKTNQGDFNLSFFQKDGRNYGIVGIDLYLKPGIYKIQINQTENFIEVIKGKFPKSVSRQWNTRELTKKEKERIAKEHDQLNEVLGNSDVQAFWLDGFLYPIDQTENTGQITSPFGQYRINPDNKKKRFHHGADFRAPAGFHIKTIAAGKVVYAGRDLFLEGNITIINHGAGIFSLYLHQSEILVKVGDVVNKGQIIGKVGSTGNSNAPHLHLAVRVNRALVDPIKLIESLK